MQVRRRRFFGHVARTYTSLDITRALKVSIRGLPRIGDAHPDVLVIPGYAPWKQISNLLTLASTQHGNTLRIENTGSASCKPIRSSSGLALDDETSLIGVIAHYHDFAQRSKTVVVGRMFVFSKLGKYKLSVNFILPHDSSKSKYSQYSQPATLLHCVRG